MAKKTIRERFRSFVQDITPASELELITEEVISKPTKTKLKPTPISKAPIMPPPRGQSSVRDTRNTFFDTQRGMRFVSQTELSVFIPLIRKLTLVERNMGQVLHDMVLLTNSGFKLEFDPGVTPELRDKMRREIDNASKTWLEGGYGLHSIINKVTSQVLIGGAASGEWVASDNLKGVDRVVFVNPEDILFGLNNKTGRYEPYQVVHDLSQIGRMGNNNLTKLNEVTYKYIGFLGDTDVPYGIPIFLTALKDLDTQEDMIKNIAFLMKQLGIMGFTELLIEKPGQQQNENDTNYAARLRKLLNESKENILAGVTDGVLVGFAEDHKYTFNSTTQNMASVPETFKLNQQLVASGLKYSSQFMSGEGGTDTAMSIIFTKMLAQLTNIQAVVATMMNHGLTLHLRLKGFNFEYLNLKFKASTITDDMKIQQAREIKQRVNRLLHDDGIINQDEYADDMGYAKPDMPEARITHDPLAIAEEARKAKEREVGKDKSDRTGRDKKNPQPKRKDGDSKPR